VHKFVQRHTSGETSISRQIKQSTKDLEDQPIDKELTGHHFYKNTRFSKNSHLFLHWQICSYTMKQEEIFPTKMPKFTGNPLRDGGTYLTEFLPSLETAQE
jgi:hypothetical protein